MKSVKHFLWFLFILSSSISCTKDLTEPDILTVTHLINLAGIDEGIEVDTFSTQVITNYIKRSNYLVILKFTGDFCPPCKQIKPKIEKLAREYKSTVRFIEVDISSYPEVAKAHKIRSVPSFIFFYKDPTKELLRLTGSDQLATIKSTIKDHAVTYKLD